MLWRRRWASSICRCAARAARSRRRGRAWTRGGALRVIARRIGGIGDSRLRSAATGTAATPRGAAARRKAWPWRGLPAFRRATFSRACRASARIKARRPRIARARASSRRAPASGALPARRAPVLLFLDTRLLGDAAAFKAPRALISCWRPHRAPNRSGEVVIASYGRSLPSTSPWRCARTRSDKARICFWHAVARRTDQQQETCKCCRRAAAAILALYHHLLQRHLLPRRRRGGQRRCTLFARALMRFLGVSFVGARRPTSRSAPPSACRRHRLSYRRRGMLLPFIISSSWRTLLFLAVSTALRASLPCICSRFLPSPAGSSAPFCAAAHQQNHSMPYMAPSVRQGL